MTNKHIAHTSFRGVTTYIVYGTDAQGKCTSVASLTLTRTEDGFVSGEIRNPDGQYDVLPEAVARTIFNDIHNNYDAAQGSK